MTLSVRLRISMTMITFMSHRSQPNLVYLQQEGVVHDRSGRHKLSASRLLSVSMSPDCTPGTPFLKYLASTDINAFLIDIPAVSQDYPAEVILFHRILCRPSRSRTICMNTTCWILITVVRHLSMVFQLSTNPPPNTSVSVNTQTSLVLACRVFIEQGGRQRFDQYANAAPSRTRVSGE
jgi:hypothetical protein